jgi:hypothetical protein
MKNVKKGAKDGLSTHGLYGEVFFDIPVYRIRKEKYELEQEQYIQKVFREAGPYATEMYQANSDTAKLMRDHLWMLYGGAWPFNEIIGFIRLYFFFTQIRGEYWQIDCKRITRTRKKIFVFHSHNVTYEEEIPPESSSKKIFQLIQKYLERAQKELGQRYVDASVFERIGQHIDWKGLHKCSFEHQQK